MRNLPVPLALFVVSCQLVPPEQASFDAHRDLSEHSPVYPGVVRFGTDTIAGRGGEAMVGTHLAVKDAKL